MPRTAGNVLRSLGIRHSEQADELERLATVLDRFHVGAITADRLRAVNAAWARGTYWCEKFSQDQDPLLMP